MISKVKSKAPDWSEDYIYKAYRAAASGLTDEQTAAQLGLTYNQLRAFFRTHPAIKRATEQGKADYRARQSGPDGQLDIMSYCYQRLPPELQDLWDEIQEVWNERHATVHVARLLRDQGKMARQALFIHALGATAYRVGDCCRILGISKTELSAWSQELHFAQLLEELSWHKGNFFEDRLLEAVAQGNTLAILHANKTFNRDRGYGDRLEVSGTVNHVHNHVLNLEDIPLDDSTLGAIINAVKASGKVGPDGLIVDSPTPARLVGPGPG